MEKYLSEINYDQLVEKALKHVVIEALKIVERQGLPGDHHFYVAFRTDHPGVKMDDLLRSQYPKEMTIVLQNQFSDLAVNDNGFAVTLKFSRVPYRLEIPFAAVTYFGDPSVRFGVSFGSEIDSNTPPEETKPTPKNADVVSIDAFRKKGNAQKIRHYCRPAQYQHCLLYTSPSPRDCS